MISEIECVESALTDTKLLIELDGPSDTDRFATLGRLVPGIAHDVNNLASVICGYAELLTEEFAANDPRRELTGLIRDFGRQVADLMVYVNGLGRAPSSPRLRFPELFQKLSRILPRIVGPDVKFSMDCAGEIGTIGVEPVEALQVVLNLVGNAREATAPGGIIALRVVARTVETIRPGFPDSIPPGRYALLTVADTGRGIPDEILPYIFQQRFTTRGDIGGTGTGLATVARIVAQANGRIQVDSEPDWGTRFRLYFPLLK